MVTSQLLHDTFLFAVGHAQRWPCATLAMRNVGIVGDTRTYLRVARFWVGAAVALFVYVAAVS